jgi:hypothetical protein
MTGVTHEDRQAVLAAASAIVPDPSDAMAVVVSGGPILDFLEAATSEDDLNVRRAALERHHANVFFAAAKGRISPEHFVQGMRTLYIFGAGVPVPEAAA